MTDLLSTTLNRINDVLQGPATPAFYECHCGKYHDAGFFHIDAPGSFTFDQVEALNPKGWTLTAEPMMRDGVHWYELSDDQAEDLGLL